MSVMWNRTQPWKRYTSTLALAVILCIGTLFFLVKEHEPELTISEPTISEPTISDSTISDSTISEPTQPTIVTELSTKTTVPDFQPVVTGGKDVDLVIQERRLFIKKVTNNYLNQTFLTNTLCQFHSC